MFSGEPLATHRDRYKCRHHIGAALGLNEAVAKNVPQQSLRRLQDADLVLRMDYGDYRVQDDALAEWLRQCQLDTVVMESTGVSWIALFEVLEERGFDVKLVDPHSVRQVPGRKTDVKDCQWLQELHTYGLLRGAFCPEDEVCVLRSYCHLTHKSATSAKICVKRANLAKICVKFFAQKMAKRWWNTRKMPTIAC